MKKRAGSLIFSVIVLQLLAGAVVNAQETQPYGKNAISFNLTRLATSEINMTFEHFINSRRSLAFSGSLVYVHDELSEKAKDYTTTPLFSEHGYAGRFHYKIFRRTEGTTKWRDYIAPGLIYKHLYYNKQWIEYEKRDDDGTVYHERIEQSRIRDIVGVEFLWGKVYEMSRTFAFEFYYGADIRGTFVSRTDYQKQPDDREPDVIVLNSVDDSFYMRPSVQLGIIFRIRK